MTSVSRSTSRWSPTPGRSHLGARIVIAVLAALALGGCAGAGPGPSATGAAATAASSPVVGAASPSSPNPIVTSAPTPTGSFTLAADAFAEGGAIPREYTCQGANVSPALAWSGAPTGTAELVLVVDDPDAGGFVHWIALIGGGQAALPRDVSPTATAPQQGINGFGRVGWGGPCPPSGTHHYRFTLTALGATTGLAGHPSISQIRSALSRSSVLATAVLTGTYRKT